jgi:hypothetical protein
VYPFFRSGNDDCEERFLLEMMIEGMILMCNKTAVVRRPNGRYPPPPEL